MNQLRLDGFLTCWSSGSFYHREKLKAGFESLGLGDYAPNPSTYDSNLKHALNKVFDGSAFLIRPNKGGFNVVEEVRGEKDEANEFIHRYTFWLDGADHNVLMMNPVREEKGQEVATRFNEFCSLVSQGAVTRAMVGVVGRLSGIPLRPTGGVYWLPAAAEGVWVSLAGAIEGGVAYGVSSVYLIRHTFDADSVRAVRDAMVNEAVAEAARIEQEVLAEDLGAKALRNRQDEANRIGDKLRLYEHLLGQTLDEVKGRLESVQGMAAVAAMRAAGAAIMEVPSNG